MTPMINHPATISLLALFFSIPALCQTNCPATCLCHLDQIPRAVMCASQGLDAFPENISDMVNLSLKYIFDEYRFFLNNNNNNNIKFPPKQADLSSSLSFSSVLSSDISKRIEAKISLSRFEKRRMSHSREKKKRKRKEKDISRIAREIEKKKRKRKIRCLTE